MNRFIFVLFLFITFACSSIRHNNHINLTKKVIAGEGDIMIHVFYYFGGEQEIYIEKSDSNAVSIRIITKKEFSDEEYFSADTTFTLNSKLFAELINIEDLIKKQKIKPTYNCNKVFDDGVDEILNHNNTTVIYNFRKNGKLKIANTYKVYGGFFSLKEELLFIGKKFCRCKTQVEVDSYLFDSLEIDINKVSV